MNTLNQFVLFVRSYFVKEMVIYLIYKQLEDSSLIHVSLATSHLKFECLLIIQNAKVYHFIHKKSNQIMLWSI